MITHWTSPDGLRVFGKLTIEWGDGPNRYRLNYRPEMGGWGCDLLIRGEWCYYRNISPDIALALIQQAAREWLEGRSGRTTISLGRFGYYASDQMGNLLCVDGKWYACGYPHAPDALHSDDYDQALIAAILAAGE